MESKSSADNLDLPKKKKSSRQPEAAFNNDSQDAGIIDKTPDIYDAVNHLLAENQKLNDLINQLREDSTKAQDQLRLQIDKLNHDLQDANMTIQEHTLKFLDLRDLEVTSARNEEDLNQLREDLQPSRYPRQYPRTPRSGCSTAIKPSVHAYSCS